MSEEKLYVIKSRSDDNFYFSGDRAIPNWSDNLISLFGSYEVAKEIAEDNNGQPVTFVEEPKKVVLSEKQAEIVKNAHGCDYPATSISGDAGENGNSDDEELLMNAYVNGYTVAKEKKYNVKVPHTDDSYFYKIDDETCNADDWFHIDLDRPEAKFTKLEIDHYHLQEYKKEEVNDDDE